MIRARGALAGFLVICSTAALGVAATQVHAATARGSLVYARGGNIWVSKPDGSAKRRITRDGTRRNGYEHPTQANNGVIVALRGTHIHRFTPGGRRLGKPRRVSVGLANEGSLHELAEAPEISPNGKRVALYKTLLQGTYDPSTGIKGMTILAVTVEYRSASTGRRLREIHQPGDYYQNPSWIDNNHLLFFAPYNGFAPEVFLDTFGGRRQGWFADEFNGEDSFSRQPLDDGELSPAGDRLALVRGTNVVGDSAGATLQVYSVTSPSALPTPLCSFRPPGVGPFAGPSWSPDGTSIAWSDRRGVWIAALNPAGGDCGVKPKLVTRGGRTPDWGAAAARRP